MKKLFLLFALTIVCYTLSSQTLIFHENFETPSGADSLTSSGTPGWALSSRFFVSGSKCDSSRVGDINSDTSKLVTNSFSTMGNSSIILEFWHICKIDFYDVGKIQISINNGATWTDLTAIQYQGVGQFANQGNKFTAVSYPAWTPGTPAAVPQASWWRKERFDISGAASNFAQVKVRFLLYDGSGGTPGPNQNYGWLIDDITVTVAASELTPPAITIISPVPQGTIYHLGPFEIKARITDASGIDTAFVVFTKNNNITDTIGMTLLTTDTMHAYIPVGNELDTFCYYIVARDGSPNHNQSSFPTNGCTSFNITSGIHFPYTDNFDINTNLWIPDSTSSTSKWEIGIPTYGQTNSAHSAPNAWDINLTTVYSDNANAKLYSPVFDFSTAINSKISFWINFDTESGYDGAWLEYSVNDSAWKRVGIINDPLGTNWYNGSYTGSLPFWTGTSNGWKKVEYPLSFLNNTLYPVKFRFMFRSDGSGTNSGFSIDDISIVLPSPHDAGIIAITQPDMQLCIGNNEQLSVIVKNYGNQSINGNLPIKYKVDTLAPIAEQFNVSINPGAQDTVTFSSLLTTAGGNHTLKIYSELPLDGFTANDTLATSFYSSNALSLPFITNLDDSLSLSKFCVSTGLYGQVIISSDALLTGSSGMILSENSYTGWTTSSPDTIPTSSNYIWASGVNSGKNSIARLVLNSSGYTSLILKFDLKLLYYYNNYYTNFRVLVNGTQITPTMRPIGASSNYMTLEYNISQFLPAQTLAIDFQNKSYYPYNYTTSGGNGVFIDNIRIFEPPAFDAGIEKVLSPGSACGLGTEAVKVKIRNYGSSPITGGLTANYKLLGSSNIISENVTGTILPNDTSIFTFAAPVDLSVATADSTFNIISWTELVGDSLQYNDTISKEVNSRFVPDAPSASNDTIPYGTSATLTATGAGSIIWYDHQINGNIIHNGSTFVTPMLFDTANYYVASIHGGPGSFIVASDSIFNTTSSYPAPYGNYYKGAHHQMLILASELNAAGIGQGPIQSLAFNVTTANGAALSGFEIKIGATTETSLTNWVAGLTGVYTTSSYTDVIGWNTHLFSTPYVWDGQSNIVIETCFENTSAYTNNAIFKQSTTNYNSTLVYRTDGGGACGTSTPTIYTQRPHIKFEAAGTGCPSSRVPVVVYITGAPQDDAGVTSIVTPVTGIEMSNAELVKIKIHNFGTQAISAFSVSYKINNLSPVSETVSSSINSGDSLLFTFATPADLSAYGTYSIMSYTSLTGDNIHANDTTKKTIQNSQINYCASAATSTTPYEDIGNVSISNLNNGIATPILSNSNADKQYTDFTSLTPANLLAGASYPMSVSEINAGTTFWDSWINAYIDFNHDGIFNDTTELVFSAGTTSSPQVATVYGTVSIPSNAHVGLTRMRVVLVESASEATVSSCGTYTYGETEDYTVKILPQLAYDAGVVSIIAPPDSATENATIIPKVIVKNFGTAPITSMNVKYQLNTLTPVNFAYSGNLLPGITDTVIFNSMIMPAGLNSMCAYTTLANDSNTTNDTLCKNIFGLPAFDAAVTQLVSPVGGCGLSLEQIKIRIHNFGQNTINGNITASYKLGLTGNIVTQPVSTSILSDSSAIFTFTTPADLSVVLGDSSITIISWVTLLNDNINTNDTISKTIESLLSPAPPVTSNVSISYGTSATLTAVSTDSIYWYTMATGGTTIATGSTFVTPALYNTTTYYVAAASGGPLIKITEIDQYGSGIGSTPTYPVWITNNDNIIEISNLGSAVADISGYKMHLEGTVTLDYTLPSNIILASGEVLILQIGAGTNDLLNKYYCMGSTSTPSSSSTMGYALYDATGTLVDAIAANGYTFTVASGVTALDWSGSLLNMSGFAGATRIISDNNTASDWQISSATNLQTIGYFNTQLTAGGGGSGCSSARVPVTVTVTGAIAIDAGVQVMETPNTGFNLSPNEIVTIRIKNFGTNPVSNFSVSYKIGSGIPVTETVSNTINSGDTLQFTFATRANLFAFATYPFKAYTSVTNDGSHANDTVIKTVINNQIIGVSEVEKMSFVLGQNIPNPAKGKTIIEYNIPENGIVGFEVLDILGQTVISEVSTKEVGKHTIEIDVQNLPAGIYTYSVSLNNKRLSKRMVISN